MIRSGGGKGARQTTRQPKQMNKQSRNFPKESKTTSNRHRPINLAKNIHKSTRRGVLNSESIAPEAKSVATTFRDSTEFVKGDDGAWIGYSRPLDEGFHYYELIIDGAHVPDPNSKYYFGAMRWGSGIEIPATIVIFTRSRTFRTGRFAKSSFIPKALIPNVAHLFTPRPATTAINKRATPCCTCNTVGAKTNTVGASRVTPV